MIKLGITGSMASGKTTAAKLMSGKKYPLFSADKVVAGLYKNQIFIKAIAKKLKINPAKKLKIKLKLY